MTKPIPKPKGRTWKVWVLVDATGYPYLATVDFHRNNTAEIPHERGVKVVPATLTLTPSPRRSGRRRKT